MTGGLLVKLFCLPYAGGSASIYLKWAKSMSNSDIDLIPIEYKGHGIRMDEEFYENFSDMIEDVYQIISDEIANMDTYMIYGHSMGAYVAFEVASLLEQRRNCYALHVFLSGREAPCYWGKNKKVISNLSEEKFLSEIVNYGGMESSYLKDKEVLDIILPIIRNDFRIIESMNKDQEYRALNSPLSIMNGKSDSCLSEERVKEWKRFSAFVCNIRYYDGGHFYINDHIDEICDYICRCSNGTDYNSSKINFNDNGNKVFI